MSDRVEAGSVYDHLSEALHYLRECQARPPEHGWSTPMIERGELVRELGLTDYQVDQVVRLLVEEGLVTTHDVARGAARGRWVALTAAGRIG